MDANDIRRLQNGDYFQHNIEYYKAVALLEIAAQLAELNKNLQFMQRPNGVLSVELSS